jgi:hypothetical protein
MLTSIVGCDYCGKAIDPPQPWYVLRLFNHAHDQDADRWDLCDNCSVRIRRQLIERSRVVMSTDEDDYRMGEGGTD